MNSFALLVCIAIRAIFLDEFSMSFDENTSQRRQLEGATKHKIVKLRGKIVESDTSKQWGSNRIRNDISSQKGYKAIIRYHKPKGLQYDTKRYFELKFHKGTEKKHKSKLLKLKELYESWRVRQNVMGSRLNEDRLRVKLI